MGRLVDGIRSLALALGAPGLLMVAFLDSSILSLPEIADFLVIWMVVQHKSRLLLYASSATLGSIAGCVVLYYVGLRGCDALVRKRFHPASVEKALRSFQRFGMMAVLISSILPPPAPFKIFVLLAGVAEIRAAQFVAAVAIGRSIRYFAEGLLALRYGDQALVFLRRHGNTASLAVVALLAAALIGYVWWRRSHPAAD